MKQRYITIFKLTMASLFALGLSTTIPAQVALDQSLSKITYPSEPVEISNMRVVGRNILFDRKFSATDNWLKGMTFDVRNASEKSITYIAIGLLFQPTLKSKRTGAIYDLTVGFYKSAYNQVDRLGKSIMLFPGELTSFVISERDYDKITKLLFDTGLSGESLKVTMIIREVVFEDELKWSQGVILSRDLKEPRNWNVVKEPEQKQTSFAIPSLKGHNSGKGSVSILAVTHKTMIDDEAPCFAPNGMEEFLCGQSLNGCEVVFCKVNINKYINDILGIYDLLTVTSMCTDCQEDYCGYRTESIGVPGCQAGLPRKSPSLQNNVHRNRLGL